MPSPRAALLACVAAAVLILGSGCSGDDTAESGGSVTTEGNSGADADRADDGTADAAESGGADDDGNFTQDEIVTALEAGTEADAVAFNNNTLELTYSEGSRDEPDLQPCSLAAGLSGTLDHDIALVYPDGSYTCYGENEG